MEQPDRLSQMIVTHAVRLAEEAGPLEDAAETRAAVLAAPDTPSRIVARAWQLGTRLKYVSALERIHAMLPVAWALLALVVAIVGLSIARSVTADRHVNIMVAAVGMLGTHFVMYALWLAGVAAAVFKPSLPGGFSLGHAMLALAGRLARVHASGLLVRSAFAVIQRARLAPWAFGLVSHALWSFAFVLALAVLGFAFSFRAYEIGWETTILPPSFFAAFVHATGVVPSWFGFPIPDVARASTDQRDWAWWLIGLLTVYGLAPRALGAMVCWLLWRHGRARLRPDLGDAYYAQLAERMRLVEVHVGGEAGRVAGTHRGVADATAVAVVEFELPSNDPPAGTPAYAADWIVQRIAGTVEERRATLERLGGIQPRKLLVAVDAYATPDRGTERFLREAFSYAAQGALLLAHGETRDLQAEDRWRAWLAAAALPGIACMADDEEAHGWLEGAHA